MNRRQAKKQYKKLHGCNLENIITRINELLRKTTRHLIWKISNMPQEEFGSLLRGLTPEQKELAVKLRNKRRDD